jgi:hypothetical protein
MRDGELIRMAERMGLIDLEPPVIQWRAPTGPTSGEFRRSRLLACMLSGMGRPNRIAQSDAVVVTVEAMARTHGTDPIVIGLAIDNLNAAAAQHWATA